MRKIELYFRFPFFKEKNLDTFKKNSRKKNKCNLDRNLVPDSFESVWADKCQQVNANLMVAGNNTSLKNGWGLIYECEHSPNVSAPSIMITYTAH